MKRQSVDVGKSCSHALQYKLEAIISRHSEKYDLNTLQILDVLFSIVERYSARYVDNVEEISNACTD